MAEVERHATARDLRAILGVQAIRAHLYGLGRVVIGASLADGGLSAAAFGVVFTSIVRIRAGDGYTLDQENIAHVDSILDVRWCIPSGTISSAALWMTA